MRETRESVERLLRKWEREAEERNLSAWDLRMLRGEMLAELEEEEDQEEAEEE